jgi:Domain of unknown function (DUF4331)
MHSPFTTDRRRARWPIAVAIVGLVAVGGAVTAHTLRASDHADNPLVEVNPAMDMSDVYAFPGGTADRIVLAMDSHPLLTPAQTPGATFDPNILYQFKVDNTGDAKEDRVIQVTFKGTGTNQTFEVRGPMAPPVIGPMMNTVANVAPAMTGTINTVTGTAGGMQVYAGAREDPFFLDLEQFLRILPDRKPNTTAFSLLPDTPTASSFRAAGSAVDALKGSNVLSIVIELPTAQLTTGGSAKLGIWGTISR